MVGLALQQIAFVAHDAAGHQAVDIKIPMLVLELVQPPTIPHNKGMALIDSFKRTMHPFNFQTRRYDDIPSPTNKKPNSNVFQNPSQPFQSGSYSQ
jgi:hypothetical protein